MARAFKNIGPSTARRPSSGIPLPPVIFEPTVRLVYADLGLPELFVRTATCNGMAATLLHPEELTRNVAQHLRSMGENQIVLPDSKMFETLGLAAQLRAEGFEIVSPTAQQGFPKTLRVTGCYAAIAETGSVVIRASDILFLPPGSVLILEPRNFVPDLLDLFEKFQKKSR